MYRMYMTRLINAAIGGMVLSLCMAGLAVAQHEGHDMHGSHGMQGHEAEAGPCPGCGMDGGLCAHCEPVAEDILRNMSVGMCPDCDDPEMLCERCSTAVDGAMGMFGQLNPRSMEGPEHTMVCLEMTLGGNFEEAYGQLFALGGEQGLLRDNMMTGSVLPDAAEEVTMESPIYVAFGMPEDGEPQDPLFAFTVPEADYAVFRHFGPDPGMTWMAAYTWLALAGVEVEHSPAGEHHMGAPDADGNMLMDIFIPVDDDQLEEILGDDDDESDDDDGMDDAEDEMEDDD